MLVHISSSAATIAHGKNHRGTTTNDITTCKDLCTRGLHAVVYGDGVFAAKFQSLDRLGYQWVRRYTDSHDDLIDIERDSLAFYRYRTAAP